jgi:quinoprotein dehydrogenase-associated probable ABC transporter substrate-binding protein
VLKVCEDPNNLPFSNEKGEGFENKISELFAQKLGSKLEYHFFPQRLGFIRNTLRFKLPGQDYRCDLVPGVPAGYDQVDPTKPYYRSTYVLVYADGRKLSNIRSGQEFLALSREKLQSLRIGIYDRSPASEWMRKHDLLEQAVPYRIMNADPDYYAGSIIERDLAQGKIDAAIVWGPIGGYFSQRVKEPKLTVVPLQSEPGVKFDYAIAMGVRRGEPEWKATVERLIGENQTQINAILKDYGIPLVDEQGKPKP